jgi:spermidine synthase
MRNLLSYLFPQNILKQKSALNGLLEVNLVNGKKILDSSNSNYSFGSLQKILKRGIQEIPLVKQSNNILVLGMGAGSVVETLRNDFNSNAQIDLVDFDPVIIEIAKQHFNLHLNKNVKLIEADAHQYLKECQQQYDLIIVDLFIDNTIPEKFIGLDFVQHLTTQLTKKGSIIFNTMRQTLSLEKRQRLQESFKNLNLLVKTIERVQGTNDLLIIKK